MNARQLSFDEEVTSRTVCEALRNLAVMFPSAEGGERMVMKLVKQYIPEEDYDLLEPVFRGMAKHIVEQEFLLRRGSI